MKNRCTVGRFQNSVQEPVTLNDIRKWANNTWKTTCGINVFVITFYSNAVKGSGRTCTIRRVDLEEEEDTIQVVETIEGLLASRDQT